MEIANHGLDLLVVTPVWAGLDTDQILVSAILEFQVEALDAGLSAVEDLLANVNRNLSRKLPNTVSSPEETVASSTALMKSLAVCVRLALKR